MESTHKCLLMVFVRKCNNVVGARNHFPQCQFVELSFKTFSLPLSNVHKHRSPKRMNATKMNVSWVTLYERAEPRSIGHWNAHRHYMQKKTGYYQLSFYEAMYDLRWRNPLKRSWRHRVHFLSGYYPSAMIGDRKIPAPSWTNPWTFGLFVRNEEII